MLAGGGAGETLRAYGSARGSGRDKDLEQWPSDQCVFISGAAEPGGRGVGKSDDVVLSDEHAIWRLLDQDSVRFARHVTPGSPSGWIRAGEVVTGKIAPGTSNAGTV